MNKILLIAKKEFELIKAQKLALLLIIIYPLIVMLILSVSFSEVSSLENIRIGMLLPNTPEAQHFLDKLKENQKLSVIHYSSLDSMKEDVASKKIVVGIEIENISSEYESKTLNFYYDNSNILTSKIFFGIARTFVQSVGYESVKIILESLFSEFKSVREQIISESGKIDALVDSINSLNESVNSINLSNVEEIIETQKTTVESINEELNSLDANVSNFQGVVNQAYTQINSTLQLINSYKLKIAEFEVKIKNFDALVDTGLATVNTLLADPSISQSQRASLETIKVQLISLKSDLQKTKQDLTAINQQLEQTTLMVNDFKGKLSLASTLIQQAKVKIANFKELALNSSSSITQLTTQLNDMKFLLDKAKSVLGFESNEGLLAGLNESKTLLSNFLSKLEKLNKFDPKALSQPIIVKEKPLFLLTTTSALMPSVIAIVLLFSCILLTAITVILERMQGAALRMRLSATANSVFVLGRILGQLFIAFLVGIIILVISFLFRITLNGFILDIILAILIVSFAFIAWGVLITNFTKVQSTAILLSLLVMIPMLFLSGIFFPIEFMQNIIVGFTYFLPLTAANNLLMNVMIKGQLLLSQLDLILVLVVPSIFIMVFTILKEEGKIEIESLGVIQGLKSLKETLYEKGRETAEQLKAKRKEEELYEEEYYVPEEIEKPSLEEIKKEIPEFMEFNEEN